MVNIRNADYSQSFLMPPSIEEWVGEDAKVRFVREFVDALVLRVPWLQETRGYRDPGRPPYAKSLLLKVFIYGYSLKIRSVRDLEEACRDRISMKWLVGGLRPDHMALWRFWSAHRGEIGELFVESVRMSVSLNLVGMGLHALDGTKIQASASTRAAMNREQMRRMIDRLTRQVAEIEQQIEAAGPGTEVAEERLRGKLTERKSLREAIETFLNASPADERKRNRTEPEAPMMKGVGLGYNAQAVVDDRAGLIVSQNVVVDANDERQLIPMLEQVQEQLGKTATETVADGGYNTIEAVAQADEKNLSVILNKSSDERKGDKLEYHASRFRYVAERNVVICPQQKELVFRGSTRRKRQPYAVQVFRGTECHSCPVRSLCTPKQRQRTIEISPHYEAVQRHRNKREDPESKAHLRTRMTLGERPFAMIKHNLGFRRFRAKGLVAARAEWAFICLVYNITRMIRSAFSPGLLTLPELAAT